MYQKSLAQYQSHPVNKKKWWILCGICLRISENKRLFFLFDSSDNGVRGFHFGLSRYKVKPICHQIGWKATSCVLGLLCAITTPLFSVAGSDCAIRVQ